MSTYAPSARDHWGPASATLTGALTPEATTTGASVPGRDAAFFDLDNTIVRGASVFHLARGLYRRRCFTGRDIASFAVKQAKFRVRGSENDAEIACATNRA